MLRFTLFGLYEYTDGKLFDDIDLYEKYEKKLLIGTLLDKCGDLKLYYQVPIRAKHQIQAFFKRNYDNFRLMYDAFFSDYNPIENYNRYENLDRHLANSGEDVTEGYNLASVSAYNVSDYSNTNKNNSDSTTSYGAEQKETHVNHIHGNIGVTTSQQMINSELELRKTDLYLEIVRRFEHDCLISIY